MQPVRLIWVGGEHDFRLRLGELRALQQRVNAGPLEVYARISSGGWRVDDLLDVLRLGLAGGGMPSGEAADLINALADRHPLIEFALPAQEVIARALYDPSPAESREAEDTEAAPPEKPLGAGSGTSPGSTGPAP